MAIRIQGRAVRREGEVLEEVEARQGANQNIREGDRPKAPTRTSVASEAGLSEHQRKTALCVVNIPETEFVAALTCTAEGRVRAQKRGQHMGRPSKLTNAQKVEARQRRAEGAARRNRPQTTTWGKSTISRLTG
jgi:hypothetical protein